MERVGRKATGMMSGLKREEAIEMDTMEGLGMVQVKKILKGGGGQSEQQDLVQAIQPAQLPGICGEMRLNRPWPIGVRIYDCLYTSYQLAPTSQSPLR